MRLSCFYLAHYSVPKRAVYTVDRRLERTEAYQCHIAIFAAYQVGQQCIQTCARLHNQALVLSGHRYQRNIRRGEEHR